MEKDKGIFSFRKHPVGNLLEEKKGRKRKGGWLRRGMGILLAAAVAFNTMPAGSFAASASESRQCGHHRSHTPDCGYREAQPCTHEHGEECYTTAAECVHTHTDGCYPETEESAGEGSATDSGAESREPSNCTHVCSEGSGCITKVLDCHHEHDESCGYQEAQECGYVCEICNGTEPEDTENNAENDTEDADLSRGKGEKTEEQDKTGEKVITAWEWIDPEEYLTDGMLALPGAGRENPAFAEDVTALLPEKIQAKAAAVNVAEDGEETEEDTETLPKEEGMEIALTGWECASYPEDGAYEGTYTFTASLPEGFVLAEDAAGLEVKVELGGVEMLAETVSVSYQEASWNGSEVTYTGKTENCTSVESSTEAVTWNAGWYVVNGTVTVSEPITVTGAVNLILADGCTLDAEKGIVVETGNSLTIYAQSGGSGTLNATGTDSAGIGGAGRTDYGVDGGSSGAITIHGGNITATSQNGAGIGGGAPWSGAKGGSGSNITIYGGSVTASSSRNGMGGAGIGGGGGDTGGGTGENIDIYGGTVNATGGTQGAGIGGGGSGIGKKSGNGSGITISGGTVTAVGGQYAAGIGGGGGYYSSYTWGGTTSSSGCTGGTGSVTISGGIVDASSPTDVSISDYKGAPIGNGGNTTATATVNKITGIVFENGAGTVCGTVTFDGSYTVPAGYTLNIPAGASLSGSGTLSGGSAFTTENLTADMISVPTDLYYTGKDRTEDITTELSDELTKGVAICGQTFTVSGWALVVEKTGDLTYTATYTNNNDSTKTFTKTITLLKSGTKFEGDVKTYNGDTQTTTFNADDTITVKAAPAATGTASAKAVARLRGGYTEPTTGQMALFVGDIQVSDPVSAGEGGTYTMTVSAAEVLLQGNAESNGDAITLTAKFIGNDNMADAAGTVDVNITAVAKAELDGKVIGYYGESNLAGAFADSGNADATFTLLADVEPSTYLTIQIDCTLDLNGHTITSHIGRGLCVIVETNTAVTIRGEGEIIAKGGIALAVNGSVTLEGGTYTSGGDESSSVYVMGQSAMLSVSGEKVSIRNTSGGYGLSVAQAQSVRLSAGTYSGTAEAISSTVKLSDMLAHTDNIRYAFYQDSSPYAPSGSSLPGGTFTVQECEHDGVKPTSNNDGTHALKCPYCGYSADAAACAYTWDEGADTAVCACGSSLTVSVTGTDGLVYDGNAKKPAVTVTLGVTEDKVLTAGTDYTVGYSNNKAAGTDQAAVTVTGKTFHGSYTRKFSIGKATPKVTWDTEAAETLTYTGEPADITTLPTVTLVNNETFSGTINYSYAASSTSGASANAGKTSSTAGADGNGYTSGLPVNAGTYRIKAAIAEQDNYIAAESTDTLPLTINKAEGTLTVPETPVNKKYGDMDFTLECSADGDGEISYASDKEEVVRVLADGTVQIKGLGEAKVTVSLAEGTNHTAAERTVTIIVGIGENAPNMPDSAMNVPDSCLKVGDVVLPKNWEWRTEDREKPLIDETAVEAVAVYTGADRDNFENITAAVNVVSHKAGDDILYTGAGEKAPTCTQAGLGHRECTTCHAVVEAGIVVEALGHNYTGEVTKEPTTSEEGEKTYTCSRCGDTYTETIPKEIPDGLWISGLVKSVPYTGSAARQDGIRVYHGSTLLREKTEYTISYRGNTNAGTAQLIVTGKGNYKGKCMAEFTIEPVDLKTDGGISAIITTVTETGRNLKPAVTVTWNGRKLKEKKDYTLSYEAGIKSASEEGYDVVISGKGNYTGDIERKFYVRPRGTKLLNKATVKGIKKSYEYQSRELNAEQNSNPEGQDTNPEQQNAGPKGLASDLENITVKIGTTTLAKEDYTVRTENTDAVGTGYVVIEPAPASIYAGEKRIPFNITGMNIKKCFITGLAKSYPYTGEPIMPEIGVYTGRNGTGTRIPSDVYTVRYSNDTNQGKATVTVTGIPEKGYSGSVKASYSIARLNLATEKTAGSITVTMPDDIKYAKGGAKPQPVITHSYNGTVRTLREGVDYTLKYSNNTAKYDSSTATGSKKPTLKITGAGNYTGTVTENFDIAVQDIGKLEIAATDKAYNSKKRGSYYYSVPKVYDFDGKLLKSGRDYTVQYTNETTGEPIGRTDTVENGTQIRVTVTAKENSSYVGTLGRTYSVRDAKDVKDISKVKNDKIAAQQYTGSAIKPEVELYTLTGKTKNYLSEEDYEIIGYYNNIKRGNATVLIRGTGAYSGVKSITFKITSADNKLIWIGIF